MEDISNNIFHILHYSIQQYNDKIFRHLCYIYLVSSPGYQ